ncbi:hypothetical protein [Shewanella woodyi]|uniref:DUF4124 domain-containing protein n=1 Tax=Shewanella woodyi (strain ATCC 51908 / MS32) TaxID=392500 RepID=B1KEP8_SHEWM|nr:hypothetical protein [Shewanella woodyi]ACA88063.1 conserved hypothetical protein [Shewanella woodyi ATCC 51908]
MAKPSVIVTIISLFIVYSAQANVIYKCIKGEKIVFSQTVCPKEFNQRKIEFQLGITTETDSDKREKIVDPIHQLLTEDTMPKKQQLKQLKAEIYRLNQENSYFEILRANALQKIKRKNYWQKKDTKDPEYVAETAEVNSYFNDMVADNNKIISLLNTRKDQIIMEQENKEAQ